MQVGWLGLGAMGAPMAARAARAGHVVRGCRAGSSRDRVDCVRDRPERGGRQEEQLTGGPAARLPTRSWRPREQFPD